MKISIIIFVLFSITENVTMTNKRITMPIVRPSPFRVNDVVELAETTRRFVDFHQLLDKKYNDFGKNTGMQPRADFLHSLNDVYCRLDDMCWKFFTLSYAYFTRLMIEYCALAETYLLTEYDTDDETVRNDLIGFDHVGDHLFCAVAAFRDAAGINVDKLTRAVIVSVTVGRQEKQKTRLIRLLRACRESYENNFNSAPDDVLRTDDHHSRPKGATLREVKSRIIDFSHEFCSRWSPLVGRSVLSGGEANVDLRKHRSMFIRNLFQHEYCLIPKNQDIGYEESKESFIKKSDTPEKKNDTSKKVMRLLQKPKTDKEPPLVEEPPRVEKERYNKQTEISLLQLRENLKRDADGYAINAVNYYDVATGVMLVLSLVEGRKIFRGIRHVVERSCADDAREMRVDEILGIRSTLCAFKSVLDRLVSLAVDRKRTTAVRNNKNKEKFDRQATALAELLNVAVVRGHRQRTDKKIREMCKGVPELLENDTAKAHLDDDAYGVIRFHQNYFIAPLLNIKQLYLFYAYEFS